MTTLESNRTRRTVLLTALIWVLMTTACSGTGSTSDATNGSGAPDDSANTAEPTTSTPEPTAVGSAGCAPASGGAVTEAERTVTVDGVTRRYLLTVPTPDATGPVPVVFDFHGLSEGADLHSKMSGYSELAQRDGFVVVFPDGTGDPKHWDVTPDNSTNSDLAFFDTLLEEVGNAACIDTNRVYATGLSNGAMFTSLLICERSEVIAAAVPVAGLTEFASCPGAEPVPVLTIHGTEDPILLFNGGVDLEAIPGFATGDPDSPTTTTAPADLDGDGYPAAVRALAADNGCEPEPTDTRLTAEVIHRVYECPPGADVEFYIVEGGGHSWPSSEFSRSIADIVGPTTFDIDGTVDGWEFMSQFTNTTDR